jgi:hypothetical protein
MRRYFKLARMSCFLCVLAVGCGQSDTSSGVSTTGPTNSDPKTKYLLTEEPAGARSVKDVRKDVKDGDPLVVVGRVGGSPKPFVDGRAAFTVVDLSLVPCNEKEGDTCPTPWDFCCDSKEDLARATLLVKFVDQQGKTLPQDAQSLLGLQPLQTVVVRGRAKRDDEGNLVVLADALRVRPGSTKEGKP